MTEDAHRAAEAVARLSYGKLVAFLAARTRDVAAAEDALSEAFAAALTHWPVQGCPANPEAWLLTTARRKAIDGQRRNSHEGGEHDDDLLAALAADLDAAATAFEIPDRRLQLMFACAHPAIEPGVHVPLILQTVLGLDAAAIASLFLVSPAAMGQRLVRAKLRIREAGVPFHVPEKDALDDRLAPVLDAIYAAFAEGWTDPDGTDGARRGLAEEAIALARLVAGLLPAQAEALGLLALLLHVEARRGARRDARGEYVPLAKQDMERWDARSIDEAEALLHRAAALGSLGRYQLEAAIQSAHVHRRRTGQDNRRAIADLYDALWELSGSPVVAVNRVLAIAEARGATEALEALRALDADPRLSAYQPFWAARAELFARTGARDEALRSYETAISLERDPAVRRFLQGRHDALAGA